MVSAPRTLCSLAALAAPLLACSDDVDGPPVVDTGDHAAFVQRGWIMPTSATEAIAAGFDLDDDGRSDNAVGELIKNLAAIGLDVTAADAALLGTGDPIMAHVVRADRLDDDASVAWQLWRSAGTPLRFDGTDRIGPSAIDGALWGAITARTLAAHWGEAVARVPLFPDQPPVVLGLTDARVELVLDGACRGRLGGVLTPSARAAALDEVGRQTIAHMQAHPEHPFTTTATAVMDHDDDGVVTVAEVVRIANDLLLADVRLDRDRVGTSFALGFECAPAQLAATPTF